ncbi:hypothetical protein AB0N14_24275 [Streptomyces sp. NPDC051104]|uniref:hypothetical protein n=1 Tax=Streptomyces sp. NPDC051104 TaxID=3155044 RepID=UPI00341C4605
MRCDPLPLPVPVVRVTVVRVPARFVSGESSALARYLSGHAALPRHQRPPVREQGVRTAPNLVQNVETLAHLALVARYGAEWIRSAGTPADPGALCTVHAPGRDVRIVEAPYGLPLHPCCRSTAWRRSSSAATTAPGSRPDRQRSSLWTPGR